MPSELPPELPFEAEESEGEEDDTLFDRAFYLLEKYLRLANSEEREDWEEVWDLALRLDGAHRELQFLRNLCVEAERDDVELQSLVRDLNVGGDTKEELERAASELGKERAMRWLLGDYEQRRRQSLVGVVSLWKKAREEEEEERKLYHEWKEMQEGEGSRFSHSVLGVLPESLLLVRNVRAWDQGIRDNIKCSQEWSSEGLV
ncbi:hypothetical protein BT69DRAFT_1323599 [Atractiella rhizophila]|nr:hypothetical protein BT69DRAFT_1323599 [Atractiella rhizophila]